MTKNQEKRLETVLSTPADPPYAVAGYQAKPNGTLTVKQDTPLAECPTNLDLRKARDRAIAFNCQASGDQEISAAQPTRITACNYLVYPASRVDEESGELHEFAYLCLIDKQGKFIKTTSAVVAARIGSALSMYGPDDWKVGIPLVVFPRVSPKTKRTYHEVQIDLEAYA